MYHLQQCQQQLLLFWPLLLQSAGIGGMSHLVNFQGTDTIAALMTARKYYGCRMAGYSIPAAEHRYSRPFSGMHINWLYIILLMVLRSTRQSCQLVHLDFMMRAAIAACHQVLCQFVTVCGTLLNMNSMVALQRVPILTSCQLLVNLADFLITQVCLFCPTCSMALAAAGAVALGSLVTPESLATSVASDTRVPVTPESPVMPEPPVPPVSSDTGVPV